MTLNDSVRLQWNSGDVRRRDRAEAWEQMLDESHLPWRLTNRPADGFDATIAMRQFDGYRLIRCACSATRGRRTLNEIARTEGRALSLLHLRHGKEALTIAENEITLQAGDLVLWDSERSMTFDVPGHLEKLTLMFPDAALTSIFPNAADYVGRVIPSRRGLSTLLTSYLNSIESEMWTMSAEDLTAAMKPTMDLLATVLTMESRLPKQSLKTMTLHRIQQYIVDHLSDPDLTPTRIAESNGITPRYLHLLFEDGGVSVSQWIRERRLERCKDEIARSLATGRSITEIAFDWGFNHPSHFSRAFKQRYRMAPRSYLHSLSQRAKERDATAVPNARKAR
ncbi:MAG: helix-turn-helix domain-containing protein [Pseudomonadota bacterium]